MSKVSSYKRYTHYREWLMQFARTRRKRPVKRPIVPLKGFEDEDMD